MAYPGLTFAILVGVAIGTAIYYYFNSENYQQPHQYAHHDNPHINILPRRNNRLTSSERDGSRRRRRRNSNENCTICLELITIDHPMRKLECEHEFHEKCITLWLREKKDCPVCRKPVI